MTAADKIGLPATIDGSNHVATEGFRNTRTVEELADELRNFEEIAGKINPAPDKIPRLDTGPYGGPMNRPGQVSFQSGFGA